MCIAIVKPEGSKVPSYDRISASWDSNRDGGGYAIKRAGSDTIEYHKGNFDKEEYYNKLVQSIKPEDTALIHMRITTHGGTSKECCHPFPISHSYDEMRSTSGKCKKIMMHNGILGGAFGKVHKQGVSDTMELVKYLAKANLREYGSAFKVLMEPILGRNNKVAVLTEDGVTMAGVGWIEEDDGCFYSNDTYEEFWYKSWAYPQIITPKKAQKKAKHFNTKQKQRGYTKAYNYKKVQTASMTQLDQDDILNNVCPSCLTFMPDGVYGDYVCKYCNVEYV